MSAKKSTEKVFKAVKGPKAIKSSKASSPPKKKTALDKSKRNLRQVQISKTKARKQVGARFHQVELTASDKELLPVVKSAD
jgi:hypothetical protein